MTYANTYRVIEKKSGGTLNFVRYAENEKDTDSEEVAERKRKAQAIRLRDNWVANVDPSLTLIVVKCDGMGHILDKVV
jgi:hypothetical protein